MIIYKIDYVQKNMVAQELWRLQQKRCHELRVRKNAKTHKLHSARVPKSADDIKINASKVRCFDLHEASALILLKCVYWRASNASIKARRRHHLAPLHFTLHAGNFRQ